MRPTRFKKGKLNRRNIKRSSASFVAERVTFATDYYKI